MTDFNDRIEMLAELEGKATPGEWTIDEGEGRSLAKIYAAADFVGDNFIPTDAAFIVKLRNDALPLLREMAQALSEARAENEQLRNDLFQAAAAFAESGAQNAESVRSVIDAAGLMEKALSEAQADARVFSNSYNALAEDFGRLKEDNERLLTENEQIIKKAARLDKRLVLTVEKASELQIENERLREGIGRAHSVLMNSINTHGHNLVDHYAEVISSALIELEALHDA